MKELWAKYQGILWTLVRVWLGYEWITAGWHKLADPKGAWIGASAGTSITKFLQGSLTKGSEVKPWYTWFVKNVALPNANIFTYIIPFGEFLVGLALILGILTTFALYMAVFMNLNFLLAGTSSSNPYMLVLEMILLFVGASAITYGVDRYLMPWCKKRMCKDGKCGPQTT